MIDKLLTVIESIIENPFKTMAKDDTIFSRHLISHY